MKYYKARIEKHDYFTGYTVAENELLTAKERHTKARYIEDYYFTLVDVKKVTRVNGKRFEGV